VDVKKHGSVRSKIICPMRATARALGCIQYSVAMLLEFVSTIITSESRHSSHLWSRILSGSMGVDIGCKEYLNIWLVFLLSMARKTEREHVLLLPKFDNSGQKISHQALERYALKISERFGGVTVIPVTLGCSIDPDTKKLQCEENVMYVVSRDLDSLPREKWEETISEDSKIMRALAKEAGDEFGQWGIMLTEDIIKDVGFITGVKKERIPKEIIEKDLFARRLD